MTALLTAPPREPLLDDELPLDAVEYAPRVPRALALPVARLLLPPDPPALCPAPGTFHCDHADADLLEFIGFITYGGRRMAEYFCHHCEGGAFLPD